MAASDVLVSLGADSSELQGSLAGLADEVIGWLGGINPAVAGVVGVIAGIGVTAFKAAEDFHEAYNEIIVGTGATGQALTDLEGNFKAVFNQVPQDAAEVGKSIASVNTALGLTGTQLESTTKGFLDMSDSLHEDVGPLIQNVTQAMNAWGVSASEATLVNDKLLTISQQTGVSATKLAGALTQSEGSFKQWGLSMDESAVLLGRFSKAGVDAGSVAGSLEKAIKVLGDGVTPSKEALAGIIDEIKNAGTTSESTEKAITLFGKSGVAMGQAIREGKLDIDDLTSSLAGAEGQVARTDDATATIGENFTTLSHTIEGLLEPLGVVLVDGLNAVVLGFSSLFDPMTYTSDGFKAILDWVKPLTDAFTANFLPAITTIGTLLLGLGVTIVQGALIPALTFLWNNVLVPLGGFLRDVLAGAINTVYGALNTFLGILKDIPGVSALFEAGQRAINTALGDGKTKADEAGTSAGKLKDAHGDLAKTLDTQTHPAIKNVIGALGDKTTAAGLAKEAAKKLEDAEKTLSDGYDKLQVPAIKSLLEAQRDVNKARQDLTDNTKKLFDAEQDLKAKLDNTKTSSKDLKSAMDAVDVAQKAVKTSSDNLKNSQTDLATATKTAKEKANESQKAFDELAKEIAKIPVEVVPQFEGGVGALGGSLDSLNGFLGTAQTKAFDAQNALIALGVTPKEDLKGLADAAAANFKTIQDSGTGSATESDRAQKASLEAMVGYYKQAGIDVPKELQTTLDGLKAKYDTHKGDVTSVFESMKGAVQQSITSLSTDLVKSLFEDPGSFGKKAMDSLKTLGESVLTSFITPATNAISGFVSGALADLLGGKGFGGITDRLSGLGDAFSGLFGGGSSATSAVGGATGGVPSIPGLGGAPGAASGAASSGLSTAFAGISAVSGVVTAITGVLSMFGVGVQGNMSDSLKGIHNDTTYLAKAFGDMGLKDSLLDMSHDISNFVNGAFGGWYLSYLQDQGGLQYEMNDRGKSMLTQLESINGTMTNRLAIALDTLAQKKTEVIVNVQAYLDGKEIAAELEQDIQLATA